MLKNKFIVSMFAFSALLVALSAVVGFIGLPQEPGGPLIIRFDASSNQAGLLGGRGLFLSLSGIATFIVLMNFVLALEIYKRDRFLSNAIGATTLVVAALFLMASINIAAIN